MEFALEEEHAFGDAMDVVLMEFAMDSVLQIKNIQLTLPNTRRHLLTEFPPFEPSNNPGNLKHYTTNQSIVYNIRGTNKPRIHLFTEHFINIFTSFLRF